MVVSESRVPCLVACHVCSREFGAASIDVHLEQCIKKWEDAQQLKPRQHRESVPECPNLAPDMTQADFNRVVRARFRRRCAHCGKDMHVDQLPAHLRSCPRADVPEAPHVQIICQSCGRAFPDDHSLQQHLAVCGLEVPGEESQVVPIPMPFHMTCHLCGCNFGSKSFEIHVQYCQQKWQMQEMLKEADQRRPVPSPPAWTPNMTQEQYNEAAREICIKEAQLRGLQDLNAAPLPTSACRRRKPKSVTCETCGREFTEASITLHRRKCAKLQQERKRHPHDERGIDSDSPDRSERAKSCDAPGQAEAWVLRSHSADAVQRQRPQTPKTVPCQFCGKNFLYTSIKVHQNQCGQRQRICHAPQKRENSQRLKARLRSRDSTPRGKTPSPDPTPAPGPKRFAKFVTCKVCGQLFGTKSIHCHVPRCQKLREAREAQKPIWDRQLQAIPRCAKENVAEEMPTRSIPQDPKVETAASMSNRPLAVVCHLCGRHFSRASIAIHLPRCRKIWEEREHTKPPKERRKVPPAPEADLGSEGYNQRARIIYKEKSAEACPRCGRRLADDKQFRLHLASCNINSLAMPEEKEQDQLPRGCLVLVTCHLCGKDFGTASIVASSSESRV
ncbi:Zinc finger protein 474 [Symbiodinium microadriaticum]|uniref:Zinc finger protein 474 n=1 Tax=Symbiodinium microadriaticum TaxID=2951 RepID=A0A1Q9EFL6_SYMMI|nr:Zinc finger protein 474 [Symbiodinium microadriaticum]